MPDLATDVHRPDFARWEANATPATLIADGMLPYLMGSGSGERAMPDDLDPVPPAPDWTVRAACLGKPSEWWFPGKGETGAKAKAICGRCPVRDQCLAWALEDLDLAGGDHAETTYRYGIVGGLSAKERTRLARNGGVYADEAARAPSRQAGDAARGERLIAEAVRGGVPAA